MNDKKKLAQDFAKNKKVFDADFPYINDVEFLTYLKEEYIKMQDFEVCMIIDARIKILEADIVTDEMIDNLNYKIGLYKAVRGNLN